MALCLAVVISSVGATTGLGTWLFDSQTQLADTAAITRGAFFQSDGSVKNQSETVVTYTPESAVSPIVAYGTTLYGRSTIEYVEEYLQSTGKTVVAGINGSFFDMSTGIPLGCVITQGILRCSGTGPAVGFRADGSTVISDPGINVQITYPNGNTSNVHYNKQLTVSNGAVLYSRDYDTRTKNTISCYHVILAPETATLSLQGTVTARVTGIVKDATTCDIPEGGMVLAVATNTQYANTMADRIFALKEGDTIQIATTCQDSWADVVYGCSGGELLVEAGKAKDTFTLDSADRATARTAVGLKADGTLVLYTVDGLQASSMGLTLPELAQRMAELGCVTALNLDGGGSTAVGATCPGYADSTVVNSPSDGSLRRCANYIFLVRDTTAPGQTQKIFLYPYDALALPGAEVPFTVLATDEHYMATQAPESITYEAQGGTVTQDGVFTAGAAGIATVTARSDHMASTRQVAVITMPSSLKLVNAATGKTVASLQVTARNQVDLNVEASYHSMPVYSSDKLYAWKVTGDIGTIDENGVFTAVQTTEDKTGSLQVTMGQITLTLPVTVKAMVLEGRAVHGFEADDPQAAAAGTGVGARINRDLTKVRYGTQSLKVDYDFTAIEASQDQKKQGIVTTAKALQEGDAVLGLWVYSDGSGNALSARILSGGQTQSLWLTTLDTAGWKYVTAQLPAGEKTLAGFAVTQEETGAASGTLYLDQVTAANGVLEDVTGPVITTNQTETGLEITVQDAGSGLGSVQVTLDGKEQTISFTGGKGTLPLPTDGAYHKVTVTAQDRFGNLSSVTVALAGEQQTVFADTQGHWAGEFITYLCGQGVLTGSTNSQGQLCYRPEDSMTRQEFVVALMRYLGAGTTEQAVELPFADAGAIADWAYDAMASAYAMGLVTGSAAADGKLYANPTQTITRQEAMAIIGRTQEKGYTLADLSAFSDAGSVADWAREYIAAMVSRGIIAGSGGNLLPQGQVTRAQVAKMLFYLG